MWSHSIAINFQKPIAFSVGFEDSPDLENARRVAEFLDIPHEVLVITPQQCIDVIPGKPRFENWLCLRRTPLLYWVFADVIYALETFDPLVIRCGIPHYLLCKHIAKTSEVKVLLSGECFAAGPETSTVHFTPVCGQLRWIRKRGAVCAASECANYLHN